MGNLETSLSTPVDKAHGNTGGAIVDRFIKPRASIIFVHLVYPLDGIGPSIAISGPHEEFLNNAFVIWIGGIIFQIDDADQSGCMKYGVT